MIVSSTEPLPVDPDDPPDGDTPESSPDGGFRALPGRVRPRRGRPRPGPAILPWGHASAHWLASLRLIPGFNASSVLAQSVCSRHWIDKNAREQTVRCTRFTCPRCVTKTRSKRWAKTLIAKYRNRLHVYAATVSCPRVDAKGIKAAIAALRKKLRNLNRLVSWGGIRSDSIIHVDFPTRKHPGYKVHVHMIVEASGPLDRQALREAVDGLYLAPLKNLDAYATYVTHVNALIPGFKRGKYSGRYEAQNVPGADLNHVFAALKRVRRRITWTAKTSTVKRLSNAIRKEARPGLPHRSEVRRADVQASPHRSADPGSTVEHLRGSLSHHQDRPEADPPEPSQVEAGARKRQCRDQNGRLHSETPSPADDGEADLGGEHRDGSGGTSDTLWCAAHALAVSVARELWGPQWANRVPKVQPRAKKKAEDP